MADFENAFISAPNFFPNGFRQLAIAISMAVCNALGSLVGTHLAFRHGNRFVLNLFLVVVSALILKFAFNTFI
jgi:uncharacterized protein